MTRRRVIIILLIVIAWIAAIAVAASLDATVASFVRSHGIDQFMSAHKILKHTFKLPGEYGFTIAVMIAFLFHRLKWRASLLVLVGTAVSGANGLIKWVAGRTRPYKLFDEHGIARLAPFDLKPFVGGIYGLFGGVKNLCFPSGHAALAFATAASAAILLPRWRWAFYAGATLVALERISENAHWLSDNVAAAALGIGGVWIIRRLWWDRFIRNSPAPSRPLGQLDTNGSSGSSTVPVAGDSRL